jgi:hypothetical protein
MMLFYSHLIIIRELYYGQSPSLATRAHQTLDKTASSVLIIGTLADLKRSRTDLVVENALLRQQLIVLNRKIKQSQLTNLVILKNKLSSLWTVNRNRLAKF